RLLQLQGHVEVEEGDKGFDAAGQKLIDHVVVKPDRLRIDFSPSPRNEPRPGDGKPEGVVADLLHQTDVFPIAVIKVGGGSGAHIVVKAMGLDFIPMVPNGFSLS